MGVDPFREEALSAELMRMTPTRAIGEVGRMAHPGVFAALLGEQWSTRMPERCCRPGLQLQVHSGFAGLINGLWMAAKMVFPEARMVCASEAQLSIRDAIARMHPECTVIAENAREHAACEQPPFAHLYMGGWPCPAYSRAQRTAGKGSRSEAQRGLDRVRNTQLILDALHLLNHPSKNTPWMMILEQVAGLADLSCNADEVAAVREGLVVMDYVWHERRICPARDLGDGTSRERWAWVGVRTDVVQARVWEDEERERGGRGGGTSARRWSQGNLPG
jgi:site-specific DNA-cytosine methylase